MYTFFVDVGVVVCVDTEWVTWDFDTKIREKSWSWSWNKRSCLGLGLENYEGHGLEIQSLGLRLRLDNEVLFTSLVLTTLLPPWVVRLYVRRYADVSCRGVVMAGGISVYIHPKIRQSKLYGVAMTSGWLLNLFHFQFGISKLEISDTLTTVTEIATCLACTGYEVSDTDILYLHKTNFCLLPWYRGRIVKKMHFKKMIRRT